MNKFRLIISALAIAMVTMAFASLAQAQATRTWVSGVGDDVNPCSRTAPCKTYAGAISKTAKDGEISTLDPGGFGGVTITKSMTINGTHGQGFGSILAAGANGVIINITDAGDVRKTVRLITLDINGASTGINGVRILAATRVFVEDCKIDGFTNRGITDERTVAGGSLFVSDTTIRNNTQSHIVIAPTGAGSIAATIDNVRAENSTSNTGFVIVGNVKATVRNSVATGNVHGFLAQGTGAELNIVSCLSSHNSNDGINVTAPGIVRLKDSTVTNNGNSINAAGQVQVSSTGTNTITGNTTNNLPTGPPIAPS
jgi:hypothetical protein